MRTRLALILAALAGCTTIDHQRVEGWPKLEIVEHRVSADEMLQRCRKYASPSALPIACAEFNLAARRCDIWLSKSFAPRSLVEHERLHCAGYDHVGSANMQRLLQQYHAGMGAAGAAAGGTRP